jgi:hypothetical protein
VKNNAQGISTTNNDICNDMRGDETKPITLAERPADCLNEQQNETSKAKHRVVADGPSTRRLTKEDDDNERPALDCCREKQERTGRVEQTKAKQRNAHAR